MAPSLPGPSRQIFCACHDMADAFLQKRRSVRFAVINIHTSHFLNTYTSLVSTGIYVQVLVQNNFMLKLLSLFLYYISTGTYVCVHAHVCICVSKG